MEVIHHIFLFQNIHIKCGAGELKKVTRKKGLILSSKIGIPYKNYERIYKSCAKVNISDLLKLQSN